MITREGMPGNVGLLILHKRSAPSLVQALEHAGVSLDCAYTRRGACNLAKRHRYTVVLALGAELAAWLAPLRASAGNDVAAPVTVLLLPAYSGVQERLSAYRSGADVCLSDWTDIEVLTRIQAWERRRYGLAPRAWSDLAVGLRVGPDRHVFLGNLKLPLTTTERAILAGIIDSGKEGIKPAELCKRLAPSSVTPGSVRVHVCAVRKMLLSYAHAPRLTSDRGSYRIESAVRR